MRVVFMGTGAIGVPTLQALAASPHEVCAVITQPDKPAGREMVLRPSPIKVAAEALGFPILQPEKIRSGAAMQELQSLAPDIMVIVAYGQILPRSILSLPRHGCLNLHVSLLPRHRGASPIQSAILAGDQQTGVTVMQMDEGLDTGDILFVAPTTIDENETAGELHDRLAEMAPAALLEVLDQIAVGALNPIPQDNALATYAPKLTKKDGAIHWRLGAHEIARQVRAMNPWPGAYARFSDSGKVLKIPAVRPIDGENSSEPGEVLEVRDDGILVAAGKGCVLVQEVQMEGRKRMRAGEFLRGSAIVPGFRFLSLSEE